MLLEVKDIYKEFPPVEGKTLEVLRGISLQIQKGDTFSIMGSSGSGKSTLLSLLAGLDVPTRGEIILEGQHLEILSERKLNSIRSMIGIVFQQFYLLQHLNVLENVSLPLEIMKKKNAQEEALKLLEKVGLAERKHHFPNQLSGGEAQRVGIARALVHSPKILLADEPTGNLDNENGERIADLLFQLVEETSMTLILATHNSELAERCSYKKRLTKGEIHGV